MRKNTIILTNHELALISDAEVMPAKHQIIKNIAHSFNELGVTLNTYFNKTQYFKVTKGDNYEGQPYVVLDYPILKKEELENKYRILFWWGNHIQVQYFLPADKIQALPVTCYTDWINVHPNVFNNNPQNSQFILLADLIANPQVFPPLVKIVRIIPLTKFSKLEEIAIEFMKVYN